MFQELKCEKKCKKFFKKVFTNFKKYAIVQSETEEIKMILKTGISYYKNCCMTPEVKFDFEKERQSKVKMQEKVAEVEA